MSPIVGCETRKGREQDRKRENTWEEEGNRKWMSNESFDGVRSYFEWGELVKVKMIILIVSFSKARSAISK